MDSRVLSNGPTDVERWSQAFMDGVLRWNNVEPRRAGTGDHFWASNTRFMEMNSSMREIRLRVKLGRTHQQRAIQLGLAQPTAHAEDFRNGWVDVTINTDNGLQNALILARQAYMETQR